MRLPILGYSQVGNIALNSRLALGRGKEIAFPHFPGSFPKLQVHGIWSTPLEVQTDLEILLGLTHWDATFSDAALSL